MEKDIYMKLAGTGSMIWLMATLIGITGFLTPDDLFLFNGVTAIISSIGIVLITFVCHYTVKTTKDKFAFVTMLVGWFAAITNLIFGILIVTNTNSYIFGLLATIPIAAFMLFMYFMIRKNVKIFKSHLEASLGRFYQVAGLIFFAMLPWATGTFLVSNPVLIPLNVLATIVFFDLYDVKSDTKK